MRRPLTLLVTLLALVPLAACGDDDGDDGGTAGGGEVRTTPVEFGAGDDVWLSVASGGGFVPQIVNLRGVPTLLLYDDGRLVRLVDGEGGFSESVVPRFEEVQLDEVGAADLLDTFAAVVDGPDPGDPNVTDLPSTTIEVTTDGETRDLSIYALGFQDESLSPTEQAARQAASGAIDEAYALDGAEPYVPEEWLVLTSAVPTDVGAAATTVPWPLDPDRMATVAEPQVCTRVSGEDRDLVLAALEDAGFDVLMDADGDLAEVALRPVLTGDESCNLSDSDEFVEH